MSELQYKVVVGLEIHVHLSTRTKMFCGCALSFGEEANSRVCPVCLGWPGALPVMNGQAVEYAILAAMALNCKVAEFTKWDRKSYYYPDLPKNYQISQYDLPLGSPERVRALAVELQRIVRYLGISEADMQKGHMRFEPNVNLVIDRAGQQFKTPIAEVKNLNSFRALERSVAYEVQRQLDDFLETGRTMQMGNKSTRGWDDEHEATVLQREKEEAHDYRYFPDPDLVPVTTTPQWLDEIRSRLCELPLKRQGRGGARY